MSVIEHIASAARTMGLYVEGTESNLSESQYLRVTCRCDGDCDHEPAKVRLSNHVAKPTYEALNGVADYEIGPHDMAHAAVDEWPLVVVWLAKRFDTLVPAEVAETAAAIVARQDAAAAARAAKDAAARAHEAARIEAKAKAYDRAMADAGLAARVAEIETKLADPAITGNRRKKLAAKLRTTLARA